MCAGVLTGESVLVGSVLGDCAGESVLVRVCLCEVCWWVVC